MNLFKGIASGLFGMVIQVRHWLFDHNILRSKSYKVPIICVGNITIGGTGKTPTVEMFVRHYSQIYRIAVLSRGYGRSTSGYREVQTTDRYRQVGDEPLQIKRKFPDVYVVVCEKRTQGIERIMVEHPDVELIIMDDGFQHRHVKPLVNIITVDNSRPVQADSLYPVGSLRDRLSSLVRAHYFIVTKCPKNMQPAEKLVHRKWLKHKDSQKVFYSCTKFAATYALSDGSVANLSPDTKVIVMSGVGNNQMFYDDVKRRYKDVVSHIFFNDHHVYRVCDLKTMRRELETYPDAVIITTEKDAVKLFNVVKMPEDIRSRIFYDSIELQLLDNEERELFSNIDYVIKHFKNGTLLYNSSNR